MNHRLRPLLAPAAAGLTLLWVVFAAASPSHGVLPDHPLAALGLGLIGLGLIRMHREQAADTQAQPVPVRVRNDRDG